MVTVLLVDDDVSILEVAEAILEYHGYNVVCTNNGQEALQYLERGELPDLILSDTMMPVMDGRELCRKLQANPTYSPVPFVLMSGALRTHRSAVGGGGGTDGRDGCNYVAFIAKPFGADELVSAIEKVLER